MYTKTTKILLASHMQKNDIEGQKKESDIDKHNEKLKVRIKIFNFFAIFLGHVGKLVRVAQKTLIGADFQFFAVPLLLKKNVDKPLKKIRQIRHFFQGFVHNFCQICKHNEKLKIGIKIFTFLRFFSATRENLLGLQNKHSLVRIFNSSSFHGF